MFNNNLKADELIKKIKFNDKGLVPAILQDEDTGKVLMLAYMNPDAIRKTISTGRACFYSRSRQELWLKGETSGNFQNVSYLTLDCDNDTLLLQVQPSGPACHTGRKSCFYKNYELRKGGLKEQNQDKLTTIAQVITDLEEVIASRQKELPSDSYTTSLFQAGPGRIGQKVGEEAVETVIAYLNQPERLAEEGADLIYHLLVLLKDAGLSMNDLKKELKNRF